MKDLKIVYDIKSCPDELNIMNILEISKMNGVVLWDSDLKGIEPKIVEDADLKVIDSTTKEGKEILENYERDIK